MAELPRDTFGRPLASLRLSVTDRCNLRCRYCMPEDEYVWLPRTSILTFEEIARLTGAFAELGVHKVRLTGGEPLLRHDLPTLVTMIARNPLIRDLAMTTNGLLLGKHAAALRSAGLERVTVSLDTLRPERMLAFAKSARHADVLEGIAAARQAGFASLKLNSVVIRGFNDDELVDLIEFARGHGGATVRSSRWRPTAAPLPSGSGSPTGRPSASSLPSRRHSVAPAIAAGSLPTARGSSVCTPRGASTCASRYAAEPRTTSSPRSSGRPGKLAPTAGRRSGWAWRTGGHCIGSNHSRPIPIARCTPGEGDLAR